MKVRSLFYSTLCMLLLGVSFTACSDDDDDNRKNDEGSQIELPNQRVYILNEGSYQKNNAGITFYDPTMSCPIIEDIFQKQNNAKLGDTGQDMIEYNDFIYVAMYGSSYITKLNEACVEQKRYAFTPEQGQPRYLAAEDGKLYVTLSSGHVARLDANTLTFEKMVAVGKNPEQLIQEDGKLYVVNSGFGQDNRLSIIDLKTFDQAEQVEIFQNPEKILEANDKIFIQGYGGDYPNYTYPVVIYNRATRTYEKIGQGTLMAEYNDVVYVIYSETDWTTGTSTHTLYSYNARTGQKNETPFLQMPEELKTRTLYMLSINPENGEFYIGSSDFTTNGDIYRFHADGTLKEKFASGGVSPRKAVFID